MTNPSDPVFEFEDPNGSSITGTIAMIRSLMYEGTKRTITVAWNGDNIYYLKDHSNRSESIEFTAPGDIPIALNCTYTSNIYETFAIHPYPNASEVGTVISESAYVANTMGSLIKDEDDDDNTANIVMSGGQEAILFIDTTTVNKDVWRVFTNLQSNYDVDSIFNEYNSSWYVARMGGSAVILCQNINSTFRVPDGKHIQLKVYPNPVTSQLYVNLEDDIVEVGELVIVNAHGKVVMRRGLDKVVNKGVVDISSLPVGLYFVALNTNGKTIASCKFIKSGK
jgi:hypothetical protein